MTLRPMRATDNTCLHERRDGTRCGAHFGLSADGYCIAHDPARRGTAQRARSKGGKRKAELYPRAPAIHAVEPHELPGELRSAADCVTWSAWVARAVTTGQLGTREAREALTAIRELRYSLETAELAGEVERLRAELRRLKREGQ